MSKVAPLPPEKEVDDPVDPPVPYPSPAIPWHSRLNLQRSSAFVIYVVFFTIGLTLTIKYAEDVNGELGGMFVDAGIAVTLMGVWQIYSSQDMVFRKYQWLGMAVAIALIISGILLCVFWAKDMVSPAMFFSRVLLGIGLTPFITTVLFLEAKEKETLAMPYVNNFVKDVATALEGRDQDFYLVVPRTLSAAATIKSRIQAYKHFGKFEGEDIPTERRALPIYKRNLPVGPVYFDIPTCVDNASARKLIMFSESLEAYLSDLRSNRGSNTTPHCSRVWVVYVQDLTLNDLDEALLAAFKRSMEYTEGKHKEH